MTVRVPSSFAFLAVLFSLTLLSSTNARAQDGGIASDGGVVGAQEGDNCTCDDDCGGTLLCGDETGALRCAAGCSAANPGCSGGRICVFSARVDDAAALGRCITVAGGDLLPPATPCDRSTDCALGTCVVASPIGRTVCRKSCETKDDCPADYLCSGGVCTGALPITGISCAALGEEIRDDPTDQPPAESSGCSATAISTSSDSVSQGALALGLFLFFARPRRQKTQRS